MNRKSIFTLSLLIVAAGGLTIRLPRLGLRPMHADEAVQAARFRDLWQEGRYIYDPNEFHGPTLIYATLPAVICGGDRTFAGTTEATYRAVPVVFGAGLILLFWLLGDALGWWATVCAAIFAAISPAMVFYSRYYIHEMLLAFFTLAAISCGWRYLRSRKLVWCLAAGICLGLMQATKETAAIAYLAATVAFGASLLYSRWSGQTRLGRQPDGVLPHPQNTPCIDGDRQDNRLLRTSDTEKTVMLRTGSGWHFAVGGTVAVVVSAVLLSSFFSNPRGSVDGLLSYVPWLGRAGGASPHIQPWYDYFHRLVWWHLNNGPLWSEGLIVVLALIGFAASLFESQSLTCARRERIFRQQPTGVGQAPAISRFGCGPDAFGDQRWLGDGHAGFIRWIGFYTCVTITVYSAIAYKTPWCLLQFLVGMILLAGVGATAILRAIRSTPARSLVLLLLLMMTGQLAWQAYRASYLFPADRGNPYVYAQTSPDTIRLADRLDQLAEASDQHWETRVKVIWKDEYYWPLPWYLRRFQTVELWSKLPSDPAAPVVIASPHYDAKLTAQLSETHVMTDFFEIRPQVLAQLWVRTGLWEEYLRRLGRI